MGRGGGAVWAVWLAIVLNQQGVIRVETWGIIFFEVLHEQLKTRPTCLDFNFFFNLKFYLIQFSVRTSYLWVLTFRSIDKKTDLPALNLIFFFFFFFFSYGQFYQIFYCSLLFIIRFQKPFDFIFELQNFVKLLNLKTQIKDR